MSNQKSISLVVVYGNRPTTKIYHLVCPLDSLRNISVRAVLTQAKILPAVNESVWIRRVGANEYRSKPYAFESLLSFEHHNDCRIYVGRERPPPGSNKACMMCQNPQRRAEHLHPQRPEELICKDCAITIERKMQARAKREKRKPPYVRRRNSFVKRMIARKLHAHEENKKMAMQEKIK